MCFWMLNRLWCVFSCGREYGGGLDGREGLVCVSSGENSGCFLVLLWQKVSSVLSDRRGSHCVFGCKDRFRCVFGCVKEFGEGFAVGGNSPMCVWGWDTIQCVFSCGKESIVCPACLDMRVFWFGEDHVCLVVTEGSMCVMLWQSVSSNQAV